MATTMKNIREGLAANLSSIPDCQISAYRKDSPTPPTIQVTGFDEMTPTTFVGGFSILMLVQGFVGTVTDKGAQIRLDEWLFPAGDGSVWAAIESDKQLGGKVGDLAVTKCDGSIIYTLPNGSQVLGSTWHVQVEI